MNASPYGQAYRLARRLAARAATPYAFAAGIERYLVVQGFVYSENPPSRAYPLESFLFTTKLGYCQQFAGAMALLLRMGGVPARVAVGFTSGSYNSSTHEWVVSDVDAHAWVEAWFPHYGWVQFDPTPPGAPARGGHAPISVQAAGSAALRPPTLAVLKHNAQLGGGVATSHRHPSGSTSPLLVALAVALVAVLALGSTRARRRAPDGETLVAELERALARSGRPVSTGMTLAGLEHRLHGSAEAASYIRAIRLARFGGRDEPPSAEQRRALRAHLSAGLGFGGALRAIWALPPGWPARKRAWPVHFRGIHS